MARSRCHRCNIEQTDLTGACSICGGMLAASWHAVLEAVEGFLDVLGHGDSDNAVFVIPIDGDSKELGPGGVYRDVVFFA